jgi:hypothetical protein
VGYTEDVTTTGDDPQPGSSFGVRSRPDIGQNVIFGLQTRRFLGGFLFAYNYSSHFIIRLKSLSQLSLSSVVAMADIDYSGVVFGWEMEGWKMVRFLNQPPTLQSSTSSTLPVFCFALSNVVQSEKLL